MGYDAETVAAGIIASTPSSQPCTRRFLLYFSRNSALYAMFSSVLAGWAYLP